ncbi:hypothetical protein NDU88_008253 [Pleurodeles waltl]|uniref:Uncharacterized protein n=1 Tax=Pleurodeles waltl TaxID=8319 RepID=A0AAV7PRC5_PLEWA|nr:hypothetical protein NDU88_008253 [Pleurodeles waltl]
MKDYAIPASASQCTMHHTSGQVGLGADQETGVPWRAEVLQVIQGSRLTLKNKIKTVVLKVNPLRTGLCNISDKVCLVEESNEGLQTEVAALKKQEAVASSCSGALEARVEDAEGHSLCNNVRLLGIPEQAEGVLPEQFVEAWIRDTLKHNGLSPMFIIERTHHGLGAHNEL